MSEEKDKTTPLCEEYQKWCNERNLPSMSADELMYEIAAKEGRTAVEQEYIDWLADFIERWDLAV